MELRLLVLAFRLILLMKFFHLTFCFQAMLLFYTKSLAIVTIFLNALILFVFDDFAFP